MSSSETHGATRAAPRHIRALLWLHDQRLTAVAKYQNWVLFREQPWQQRPAKRRTP